MDITKFKFPKPDMCLKTDKKLITEARSRGFYEGDTEWNDMFNDLFFRGGAVEFKEGLNPEFKESCFCYLKSFMGSFEPSHEEKEAISAMLLSELCAPKSEPVAEHS